jgi:dTDP-4-dehydrorhamnose 3,5-epimerase
MKIEALAIPDVKLVTPPRYKDPRGFFSETWKQRAFAEAGITGPFIQDNHAYSTTAGVVRGLHCQIGPNAQGKLLRVVKGAIYDVAVDARHGSPTFGRYVAAILSADNWAQLWVPVGFVHGYCTLTEETEVIYKVTADYDRDAERGVIWNDPDIGIDWPVAGDTVILSDKDAMLPRLADCPAWFHV